MLFLCVASCMSVTPTAPPAAPPLYPPLPPPYRTPSPPSLPPSSPAPPSPPPPYTPSGQWGCLTDTAMSLVKIALANDTTVFVNCYETGITIENIILIDMTFYVIDFVLEQQDVFKLQTTPVQALPIGLQSPGLMRDASAGTIVTLVGPPSMPPQSQPPPIPPPLDDGGGVSSSTIIAIMLVSVFVALSLLKTP